MKLTRDQKSQATEAKRHSDEIPHQWYFNDEPCEMLGPVVCPMQRKVIAVRLEQNDKRFVIYSDDDGGFPGVTYELIQ